MRTIAKWTAVLCICAGVVAVSSAADPPAKPADIAAVELKFRELDGTLKRWTYIAAFSPANDLVAAGSKDTILVWSIDGGKPLTKIRLPETENHHIHLVFTPDGKTLVSATDLDPKVRFWDVKTGKQLREMDYPGKLPPKGDYMPFKAFGPGGAVMAVDFYDRGGTRESGIDIVDLTTGKVKVALRAPVINGIWWTGCDFSPDGKLLAVNGERDALRLIDTITGKLVRELRAANSVQNGKHGTGSVRFSPDGKFLVACEHTGRIETFDKYRAVVWGVADGKRYAGVPDLTSPPLSADNRALIVGGLAPNGPFFHDLLTGKGVPAKNPPTGDWRFLGASPDGKTAAFSAPAAPFSDDYRVYLVSVPELPEPLIGKGTPTADAFALLWSGWVSDSELRREYAWKWFGAHAEATVEYARNQFGAVAADRAKRVAELIKLLDDDSADVRDKATTDLSAMAHAFEPLLTTTHAAAGAGEVRNRLTVVLRHVKDAPVPAELTVALRGVALLEKLRTAEAKDLLGKLAKGAPGARLTDEAAAALKRLGG